MVDFFIQGNNSTFVNCQSAVALERRDDRVEVAQVAAGDQQASTDEGHAYAFLAESFCDGTTDEEQQAEQDDSDFAGDGKSNVFGV